MTDNTNDDNLREVLNQSARLLQQNRPSEATAQLQPLQKRYPGDLDIAINLGGAYILLRKWDKAVSVLEPAAQQNPDNAMLWINLGAAYLGRLETAGPRHQKRAIAAYERALQIDPNAPNVNYHLGLIYKERGEFLRAITFFERAIDINPADKDAKYWVERLDQLLAEQHGTSATSDIATDARSGDSTSTRTDNEAASDAGAADVS